MGLTLGHQPIHEGAACAEGITPSPLHSSDNTTSAPQLHPHCGSWLLTAPPHNSFSPFLLRNKPLKPPLSRAQIKGQALFEIQEQVPATKGKPSKAENKTCGLQGLETWRSNQ